MVVDAFCRVFMFGDEGGSEPVHSTTTLTQCCEIDEAEVFYFNDFFN